jgi:hypothetical protein
MDIVPLALVAALTLVAQDVPRPVLEQHYRRSCTRAGRISCTTPGS